MSRDRELRYGVRGKSLFKYPTRKALILFDASAFFRFFSSLSFFHTHDRQHTATRFSKIPPIRSHFVGTKWK